LNVPLKISVDALRATLHTLYPHGVPKAALSFDLETTGFMAQDGVVWQIGFFGAGELAYGEQNLYIKYPDEILLRNSYEIGRRAGGAEKNTPAWQAAAKGYLAEVNKHGVSPEEAYAAATDVLEAVVDSNIPILGHNLFGFDIPFYERESLKYGAPFKFPNTHVIDTAILVKSAILGIICEKELTHRQFYSKVRAIRAKGVKYALDTVCIPAFGLEAKYGLDVSKAHSAGFDSRVAWLLLAELYKLIAEPREVLVT